MRTALARYRYYSSYALCILHGQGRSEESRCWPLADQRPPPLPAMPMLPCCLLPAAVPACQPHALHHGG
jgi:hypothetical protein